MENDVRFERIMKNDCRLSSQVIDFFRILFVLIFVSVYHIGDHVSRSYDNSGTAILAFPRDARPKAHLSNRHEILRWSEEIHKTNTSHATTYPRYAGPSFFLDYRIHCIGLLHVQ